VPQQPSLPTLPAAAAAGLSAASSLAAGAEPSSAAAFRGLAVPSRPAPPEAALAGSVGKLVPASQAPPIALDGFCPVTLVETVVRNPQDRAAWKKGDPQFGAVHRGRTYLFASAEQQQKFLQRPDAYAPMFSGYDPVRYAERGEIVEGKRAYGLLTPDQRLFLFADEASYNKFNQSPGNYFSAARQAMLGSDAASKYR
jgi:YHS domain-containing protein